MPYWQYSPQNHTYISSSGRVLTEAALNEVRDAYLEEVTELIDDYATMLDEGRWTTATFESEMRRRLKNAYVAEYTLGKGGVERMTQSDYGRLGNLLKAQYGYLRGYLDDLSNGKETRGQAANRARNFIGSARQAFSRGRAKGRDLDLPYHPGDGGTECHGNCRCHWDIEEDDTEVRAYWKISAAKPCAGCLSRASESSPFVFTKPQDDE
jgi:hypothetical protein